MIFCTNNSLAPNLQPIGNDIERVKTFKLLGVILSHDFRWNSHIDVVVAKASQRLFGLRRIRSLIEDRNALWCIYFCLIRSIITYAYPAMCNMTSSLFYRLKRIENRASSIIGSLPPVDLTTFCQRTCLNISKSAITRGHRLNSLACNVKKSRVLRSKPHLAPFAKTSRF